MKLFILKCEFTDEEYQKSMDRVGPHEQLRVNRYKNEDDRRMALGGALLRQQVAPQGEVKRLPNGRPYIEGSEYDFNSTHECEYAAIAVTRRGTVGCDLCEVEPTWQSWMDDIAEQCLDGRAQTGNALSFAQAWAVKEAALKRTGDGVPSMETPIDLTGLVITEHQVNDRLVCTVVSEDECESIAQVTVSQLMESLLF